MIPLMHFGLSGDRWIIHVGKGFVDHSMSRSERHEASCPGVLLIHTLDDTHIWIPSDGDVVQSITCIG